ncbi:MAG: TonB-dependent receptor [Terriglobia bacterium]|nr:MAG: TonB-dependent receptor [Terriglobia bacterium]
MSFRLLAGLLACAAVWGQAVSTSQISGTVEDATGAAVEAAEVKVTQTDTGLVRSVSTGVDGSYILPNLPVGPYHLQVTKAGFNAYVQTGIVLQVNTNPVINATLKVGSVTEQVVVDASVAMVETHSNGVGQVIDQQRVVDLPLNGRQATELIFLSGAATTAPAGDLNTNKNYPTVTISVAGGLPNGMTYVMDGGTHNDPFNNLNLPIPFPDALQEFKVETSAVPARYGQHASAAVNAVTKSGSNQFHGSVFEFVRNYQFNARNFFAPARDSLKRNQFGGVAGGRIIPNKLFFFAGYQGTIVRSNPPTTITFVPNQAMRSGDFTTFTSAACQGRQVNLSAPFVNNQVSPALFNQQALNFLKYVPTTSDPCGRAQYGILNNNREHQIIGKIDYQFAQNHTFYGRYFIGNYKNPVEWDGQNVLLANKTGVANQAQSVVLGDNYVFSPNTISALHVTVNRTRNNRVLVPYFSPTDLGVQVFSLAPKFMGISVTGGLTLGAGGTNPGYFNSLSYQVAYDMDLIRGAHQISFGVNWIYSIMNTLNNRPTNGQFTFNGQTYGLGYADFMLGALDSFVQGNPVYDNDKSNYIGLYVQDSWKLSRKLSFNYGVRWEPFLPEHNSNGFVENFDVGRFLAGQRSGVYKNAPAGLIFPGDPGYPGQSNVFGRTAQFAPRVGLVWDPNGDGRMTIRASYGVFFDTPQLFFFTRVANNPPWGAQISLTSPKGGLTNPYADYPGGNPFPALNAVSKDMAFPAAGVYVNAPVHMHPGNLQQWNLSIQRQVGEWLLSGSYLGNKTTHLWTSAELDPAVYGPGATTGNTNQRRVLYRLNPAQGQFYSTIGQLDDGGNGGYEGLLLSAQRRLSRNFSVLSNWTWSHCISDAETTELTGPSYVDPANRALDRSNCSSDRRHIVNFSVVARTPRFSNHAAQLLAGGWQLSNILRWQTGNFATVTTGVDNALTGIGNQRPLQVLPDVLWPNATVDHYLNRNAFASPSTGTLSTMAPLLIPNPGTLQIDMSLQRVFRIREGQTLQFRGEVFNLPNHLNPNAPTLGLNSTTFGTITTAGDPRIMQFALKYLF